MLDVTEGSLDQTGYSNGAFDIRAAKRRSNFRFPYAAVRPACAAVDFLVIVMSSLAGCAVYELFSVNTVNDTSIFLVAGVIAAFLYVAIAHAAGFYRLSTIFSSQRIYRSIASRWILVCLVLAFLAFLLKVGSIFSRGSIISFALLTLAFLLVSRWFVTRILDGAISDEFVEGRRAVVVGSVEELTALDFRTLLRDYGITEVDRISLPNRKFCRKLSDAELGALSRALESTRLNEADEIVLALSWSDSHTLEQVRDKMRGSPLPVQLLPDIIVRNLAKNPSFRLQPSLSVEVQRAPLSQFERMLKRALDIAGASIALFLLLPLMVISALAIKFDSPGPILFRQRRAGVNARQFTILKFRTMKVIEDGNEVVQATKFDRRITRIGRVLRRSSLDELPQLFNVLKGDMSLVGPRPHALVHDNHYGRLLSDYASRHHVKPGITGWAQVNGYRGETPRIELMKSRVELDLWYINNWSLIFDIRILLKTCFEVMRARNAY